MALAWKAGWVQALAGSNPASSALTTGANVPGALTVDPANRRACKPGSSRPFPVQARPAWASTVRAASAARFAASRAGSARSSGVLASTLSGPV